MNRLLERMSAYLQEWEERLDAEKFTLPQTPEPERQSPPTSAPASGADLTRSPLPGLPAPAPTPVPATAGSGKQTDRLITDNLAAHKREPAISAPAGSEAPGSTPLAPAAKDAASRPGGRQTARPASSAARTPGGVEATAAAAPAPAASPGAVRITLHEFLWRKVQIEYSNSGYPEADLRGEFDKIVQAWLDCGKLTSQDGEIRLNRRPV